MGGLAWVAEDPIREDLAGGALSGWSMIGRRPTAAPQSSQNEEQKPSGSFLVDREHHINVAGTKCSLESRGLVDPANGRVAVRGSE